MNKRTKFIIGFVSFVLFCILGIIIYYLFLNALEYNQPFLTMGPDSVRESTAATLYMSFSFLITGSIMLIIQVYNNLISFFTLIAYLNNQNKKQATKFLARMLWFSDFHVKEYSEHEYLIHRMFYPQADLLQKGKKKWVVKIKYKPTELVLINKIGKLVYYKENILRNLIIKQNFSQFTEVIQSMVYFLQENFKSDLTDAQIDKNLDEIFHTENFLRENTQENIVYYSSNNVSHPSNQSYIK